MKYLPLLLLASCGAPHGFVRAAPTTDGWAARSVISVPVAERLDLQALLDAEDQDHGGHVGWIVEPGLWYMIDETWSVYTYVRRDDYGERRDVAGVGVQWSF